MANDISYILAEDISLIKEQLDAFSDYSFAKDLAWRMKKAGLSQSALAARANVTHVAVRKWISKNAKPHSKERFKELGMALGMDESELNNFLQANCYPKLYVKNPLDIVCRFVLSASRGDAHIVKIYREFLEIYKLSEYVLDDNPIDIPTEALSRDFRDIKTAGGLDAWIREKRGYFRAYDKNYIPHSQLVEFVRLYIENKSINNLYVAEELPLAVKNMLYPLLADQELVVKGLRTKLIVFGLYENMNESEIDIMLKAAKLLPFTEPSDRVDHAILTALRCAHERYSYFEWNNANQILRKIEANSNSNLYEFYVEQQRRSAEFIKYYKRKDKTSNSDRLFELTYTDYAGSRILDYIRDILVLLVKGNILEKSDTKAFEETIKTYKEGTLCLQE